MVQSQEFGVAGRDAAASLPLASRGNIHAARARERIRRPSIGVEHDGPSPAAPVLAGAMVAPDARESSEGGATSGDGWNCREKRLTALDRLRSDLTEYTLYELSQSTRKASVRIAAATSAAYTRPTEAPPIWNRLVRCLVFSIVLVSRSARF